MLAAGRDFRGAHPRRGLAAPSPTTGTQAGCTLELMHSGEARSLGFQESRDETNNLHKPSGWIQPAGCHAATSGLEVKCRFSQTWGQMLALPLVTRVTLDKSLHLSGLLCFAGRMTPPGGCCGNEMRQGSQHLAWAWPRETKVEGPLFSSSRLVVLPPLLGSRRRRLGPL